MHGHLNIMQNNSFVENESEYRRAAGGPIAYSEGLW